MTMQIIYGIKEGILKGIIEYGFKWFLYEYDEYHYFPLTGD